MTETVATSAPPVEPEPAEAAGSGSAGASTGATPARHATKFMADLSRAMQAAAEQARSETMARFETEAKGVVEEINAAATTEAADLRRKADDDVAAIRDLSKAEIARVREATEARLTARKRDLEQELQGHTATVQARTERVTAVMGAYEAQMAAFFERLAVEQDPTRIASMAEAMPDPPSLADVAASLASAQASSAVVDMSGTEPAESTAPEPVAPTEFDFAAAEAEAATLSADLDAESGDPATAETDQPVDAAVPSPEAAPSAAPSAAAEAGSTTRVVVSGLASVANIANFKRSLGRIAGVSTIGVASGRDGEFVFNVSHDVGPALSGSIAALPGFEVEITADNADVIQLTARDRDAGD